MVSIALVALFAAQLEAHAPPTPVPKPPYAVRAATLVDANGDSFLLNGVVLPELSNAGTPTFRVLRQRWNMNAVRLMASPAEWMQEGSVYLDRLADSVRAANAEGLVVILAATGDALPGSDHEAFWTAAAQVFREMPMLIFSVYAKPSVQFVPEAGRWDLWRNGGTAANGDRVTGMQQLVQAIRGQGATQIIAVPAFDDGAGFTGLTPALEIDDANTIYEIYPTLQDTRGNLIGRRAFYAAELSTNPDPAALYEALFQFQEHAISWTAAEFASGSLIRDFESYDAEGIGPLLLLWMTGDEFGFGTILADQIANTAGGPAGPIAPGELITLYGQGLGPDLETAATLGDSGAAPTTLADTEVRFDGVPAPVLVAGSFAVRVQAPYELEGRESTEVQLFYRGVGSNKVRLRIVQAAPEIFVRPQNVREAIAVDAAGLQYSETNPAQTGLLVDVLVSGAGPTDPPSATGVPASQPSKPRLPIIATIGGAEATVESANQAPGRIGVTQVRIRIRALPSSTAPRLVPLFISAGGIRSRADVRLWVR